MLDTFFYIMTHLAGVGVYAALIPTAWWIHPSKRSIDISNDLLHLISVTIYIGNFMKNLFACPRPSGVWQPLKELDFGLPSTHTMNAVANGLFVILYFQPAWWVCVLVVLYVIIIALSRIYMGVHSPADVIAGAILGFVSMAFFEFYPDFPRVWYFIPIMLIIHIILLSLHPLCFTKYTPCYWRSVLGFGYIFFNYVMEVFDIHVIVDDTPNYYCVFQHYIIATKAFLIGLAISSAVSWTFEQLLFKLFMKCTKLNEWYSSWANVIRVHCHLDPMEMDEEMNKNRLRYSAEFFTYYFTAIITAIMCKLVSPHIVQYLVPELFTSSLCSN